MISRVFATLVLTAWLAPCASPASAQPRGPTGAAVLQDLSSISELRSLFEADRDKVRIVLLLSPT
jgi:hypothetical protein